MFDPKYEEKPDHGHYAACAGRKADIDDFSRNVFVYTAGVCLVMLFITYCGAYMPLISWMPSLFGCPTCVPFLFSQTLELIIITLTAFIGFFKWKIAHICLLVFYALLVVATLFSGLTIGIVTFVIGVVGVLLTFPSFKVYSDYTQLMNTEGWPHFSIHYADAVEHPTYTSRYMSEYRSAPDDKRIYGESRTDTHTAPAVSEPVIPEMAEIAAPEPVMEDIPLAGEVPVPEAMDAPELPDGDMFEPDDGFSDEPFDIQ